MKGVTCARLMLSGKNFVRTDRFIRSVRGLWSAVLANFRIFQEILSTPVAFFTCNLSIIFPHFMFLSLRKVKRQLRIHILLDFTYTRVIFLIKRHFFTNIISYICKKKLLKISLTSFCLVINLLFSVRITLLGPLVFFLDRYGLIVFQKLFDFIHQHIFFESMC